MSFDPVIPLLGSQPTEIMRIAEKDLCMKMLMAVLFTIFFKMGNNRKCQQ